MALVPNLLPLVTTSDKPPSLRHLHNKNTGSMQQPRITDSQPLPPIRSPDFHAAIPVHLQELQQELMHSCQGRVTADVRLASAAHNC